MKTSRKFYVLLAGFLLIVALPNLIAQSTNLLSKVRNIDLNAAKELIASGADFKIKSNEGATALIRACGVSPEIAKNLLQKGTDVNVVAENGKTPLSVATEAGHEEIVEILKNHGAK